MIFEHVLDWNPSCFGFSLSIAISVCVFRSGLGAEEEGFPPPQVEAVR